MGSIAQSSLDALLQSASLQIERGSALLLEDKLAKERLLSTLHELTSALESPEDHIQRVVYFVSG